MQKCKTLNPSKPNRCSDFVVLQLLILFKKESFYIIIYYIYYTLRVLKISVSVINKCKEMSILLLKGEMINE